MQIILVIHIQHLCEFLSVQGHQVLGDCRSHLLSVLGGIVIVMIVRCVLHHCWVGVVGVGVKLATKDALGEPLFQSARYPSFAVSPAVVRARHQRGLPAPCFSQSISLLLKMFRAVIRLLSMYVALSFPTYSIDRYLTRCKSAIRDHSIIVLGGRLKPGPLPRIFSGIALESNQIRFPV